MLTLDDLDQQLTEPRGKILALEQVDWFSLPVTAANIGLWEWHPQSGIARLSPAWVDVFGVERYEEPVRFVGYLQFVHPQGRPFVAYAVADFVCNSRTYRSRHRMLRNGRERQFLGRDVAVFLEHGQRVRIIGADIDMT